MRLLFQYMKIHLKVKMQYKLSFFLTFVAQILFVFVELFLICSLFDKFSLLDKYSINELLLGFSVIWLGFSLAQTFGRGFDKFSKIISTGNFDLLLIRPQNIFLQIIGSDLFFEKVSRVIGMLILFIYSAIKVVEKMNFIKLFVLVTMIIGSFAIIMGIFIIGAWVCFYTIQGIEFVNIFTDGTKQLAQYPMTIYNKFVRNFFTYVIPITLINYFPIEFLSGRTTNMAYVFFPLISVLFIVPAVMIFKLGIKKYKSSGS